MVDVICPPLSISSIVVSLWLAGCLAKSTLIGWREYYGGGGVGVDRHLSGAQQTRAFDPMLFQFWPTANGAGPTLKKTFGRVFVFAGRAVGILIHACRLCLVGTGSTVLCVKITRHITRIVSFIQSHALAPASQAVGQRYRRWASNNPLLAQCLVFAVLCYHWTGTLLG